MAFRNIAIIGVGNMGGAVARGLSGSGFHIAVSNPTVSKLEALHAECPDISVTTDNAEAATGADIVILAVKPWKIAGVLNEIAPSINFANTVIASLAAGITLEDYADMIDYKGAAIMRIIPNTAIEVKESMTFICCNDKAEEYRDDAVALFNLMGRTAVIEERQVDAATAIASCGIAYVMRYLRATTEGGVALGLRPAEALSFAMATMGGAVKLLEQSGRHPEAEIDRVTTPGGITIRGLNTLDREGFSNAVIQALLSIKG